MNTSTASPPNPLDVYAKMTLKFKDGEPPSNLSPQLPLGEELARRAPRHLEDCEVSEK